MPKPTLLLTKECDSGERSRPDAWSHALHVSLQEGAESTQPPTPVNIPTPGVARRTPRLRSRNPATLSVATNRA